ncbi:MAG: type II toxin-antitoxin system VapC family toxin [Anaerolineae bacterium]|nr:type II toxin-antitoxin system VapC family toxin [Anaerolineae bacterium]
MADLLVDTDILIDVARGIEVAIAQLTNWESEQRVGISVITYMELLVGCRNKREQRAVERFIKRFELIAVDAEIGETAIQLLEKYRLSHGLLIADALIAATAIVRGIPLVSKNQRDYRFIEELELWPYSATGT